MSPARRREKETRQNMLYWSPAAPLRYQGSSHENYFSVSLKLVTTVSLPPTLLPYADTRFVHHAILPISPYYPYYLQYCCTILVLRIYFVCHTHVCWVRHRQHLRAVEPVAFYIYRTPFLPLTAS